jgi:hypothetical protein
LRRAWAAEIDDILVEFRVTDGEISECLGAEAICSGELARLAELLAGRVGVCHSAAANGDPDCNPSVTVDGEAARDCARAFAASSKAPLALDDLNTRLSQMARLEAMFQACARQAITDAAVQSQIEAHQIEWMRVRWRYVAVADEQTAREAVLCIRHEGESLEEVAERAEATVYREEVLLERLEPTLRAVVLSAEPKELVGPLTVGEKFRVGIVDAKSAPSATDTEVYRRGEEEVVADLVARHSQIVRWHERL